VPQSKAEFLIERRDLMARVRRNSEPIWQELAEFIHPRAGNVLGRTTNPALIFQKLYDATAPHANELLAASMMGSLTSAATRWFGLRLRGLEFAKDHEVTLLLEKCASDMYDSIAQSNHHSEGHEVYLDLGAFGIAAQFSEERDPNNEQPLPGLRFTSLAPGTYWIDENAEGRVDTVYRDIKLSARAAVAKWGMKLSEATRKIAERDPAEQVVILHAVFPRADYNPFKKGGKKNFPYVSCYVDPQGPIIVDEGGFRENPFQVPRWAKTSDNIYGHGPGFTALPAIKTLNKAVELKLRAWAVAVAPPVKVRDEGVIGTVKLSPFGITHVRDMEAVQVLALNGRFDVADMEEEKVRQEIRRIFFSDQLQLQEGPQMTAYEVQIRFELMQRVLGPTLGRLIAEYLNPMLERVFWIRYRQTQHLGEESPFVALDQILQELGVPLDIEYEGPLARAQRLQDAVAAQRFMNQLLPIAEVKPEVLDVVNFEEYARATGEYVGVPARLLNSREKVEELRAARAEQQQEQRQLAAAEQMAGVAGRSAPAIKALTEAQKQGILPAGGMVGAGVPG